jgi:hypothetical protein
MKAKTNSSIFWIGVILFVIPGLIYAYLLMPFPGSQDLNMITVSYYLEKILMPLRIIGALLLIWYFIKYFANNTLAGKIGKGAVLVLCLASFYITDIKYKAESMFEEPQTIKFANAFTNKVPLNYIIIGVVANGVAKAYPLIYLGYHHKVQDNVGSEPVLVTYCTMCRTGRVYSPVVNGIRQQFRLVGARHYNAIIEDESTKSWWYQATGNAAVGKLKGQHLKELPYEQSTLGAWLARYPSSLILQPDGHYVSDYTDLKNYDVLQAVDKDTSIKNKDSLMRKSWVIGLIVKGQAKAFDWRAVTRERIVNGDVGNTPVLVVMEKDSATYHAFTRTVNGKPLYFKKDATGHLTDSETQSTWDWNGLATAGPLKGSRLTKIQAYQEYWHSWKHFHPNTLFWKE